MTHNPTTLLTEELWAIQKYNKLSADKIAQIAKKRKGSTVKRWLRGEPVIPIKALRRIRKWHKKQGGFSLAPPKPVSLPKKSTKILSDIAAISTRHLAEAHVDWLIKTIRPLLISQFIYGYKHGRQDAGGNE